ncbi:right-handed parallel beta-helix repeat-containing protein [Blastopirellula marina]|uniref:Rhamnogalacturonase A/B/Epimerase-like pectate lyase domain-containing protein n=1 Tax=Blastopirellula marina DSM 3645 TaxID=314230 RepID=A3ZXY1_9BACT|nr:right-handed parallel beta-helix repeat-containing protein [Blastopirellula marina]EAQ78692.1 hypothetical protein DSM3645_07865 [Blastopirellula marina DSM 3645]
MPANPKLWLMIVLSLVTIRSAKSEVIDIRTAPYSAVGDGETDNRQAFAKVFAALQPNDTLLIPPGDYRISLTKSPLRVPPGVTIWGQGDNSRLLLTSDGDRRDHREFLRLASDVVLDGITLERDQEFPAVLLSMFGEISNVTLQNCRINGNAARFPQAYCHAIQLGVGDLKNLAIKSMTIQDCFYGLFQANGATGGVDGVVVEYSRFERNRASDLEFNSPNGKMQNIVVRDSQFRDNQCNSASAGFAVGFANVTHGRVENCDIRNYGSEALHVEDRSTNIELVGNTIIGGSLTQPNGVIMVVNHSQGVSIDRNFIDARANTNRPHLILVTAGGSSFANPTEVSVANNILVNGPTTKTWYLQPGSGPEPTGNEVITPKTAVK